MFDMTSNIGLILCQHKFDMDIMMQESMLDLSYMLTQNMRIVDMLTQKSGLFDVVNIENMYVKDPCKLLMP